MRPFLAFAATVVFATPSNSGEVGVVEHCVRVADYIRGQGLAATIGVKDVGRAARVAEEVNEMVGKSKQILKIVAGPEAQSLLWGENMRFDTFETVARDCSLGLGSPDSCSMSWYMNDVRTIADELLSACEHDYRGTN